VRDFVESAHRDEILGLIQNRVVTMLAPKAEHDIDTPEDYRELNDVDYAKPKI
jgi:hypothetical protein